MSDEPTGKIIPFTKDAPPPPAPPAPPSGPRGRRRGRRPIVIGAIVAVVAVLVAATVLVVRTRSGGDAAAAPPPGQAEAEAFLAAWSAGDTARMQDLVSDSSTHVADDLTDATAGLHSTGATYALDGMAPGSGDASATDRPTATFTATVQVGGLGPWSYRGTIPLKPDEHALGYKVVWSRSVIHPDLKDGLKLDRVRKVPTRAPILTADGDALVQLQPSVTIGIVPGRVQDQGAVTKALQDQLGLDPATVDEDLKQPWVKPDLLVPVITVSHPRYDKVRDIIHPIPGLSFAEGNSRLPVDDGFARQLIGSTGEITAEGLQKLGAAYQQNDVVGRSGLELAYESTLAGTPSGDIRVVNAKDAVVKSLDHIEGVAPKPVKTTLDRDTQLAAEAATAGVTQPMALVAIDAKGDIKAVVSRPVDDGLDRALTGQYPPGSTFKVVTAADLLSHGQSPTSTLTCPPTVTVDGKVFHNFEGEHGGSLSLTDAFAASCNTAFIGAVHDVPGDQLVSEAAQFGFGAPLSTGVPAAGGTVPPPSSDVEKAATAIGQSGVLASPLVMAGVAGTVQTGQWHAPRLVIDPAPTPGPGTAPAGPPPAPLDPGVRSSLDQLMHAVVASGTGTAAAVPSKDVAGKTGTAEFGVANPPQTHAWFVGYTPQLAFAVIVEGGGVGGQVAAPVAARFLTGAG